jgi:3-deoxy-7-phosphoheptulonate synthase
MILFVDDLVKLIYDVAMVIGVDGVMVEIHEQPQKALFDGEQSLNLFKFEELMNSINRRSEFEKLQNFYLKIVGVR